MLQLGFEVECYVRSEHFDKFEKKLRKLGNIEIGEDGSIEPPEDDDYVTDEYDDYDYSCYDNNRYERIEIRTSPLPSDEATELLKAIFALIDEHGGTNDTCGLHVNISSKDKKKMESFDPLTFLSTSLWKNILKDFKREDNEYCKHPFKDSLSKMQIFKKLIEEYDGDGKYSCVNLNNWGDGTKEDSRIEIRGFGNDDYHQKFDTVKSYVKRIEEQFERACS